MPGDDGDDWEPFEEKATEIDRTPVPEAVPLEEKTPRPDTTGAHRISSHEFASAVDLADRDAYARGDAHGYTRGRADQKAEDWDDGKECALRGLKVFLIANKFAVDYADAMVDAVRLFVKRGV